MIQRLTPLNSPIQIGANDESVIVSSASEGYMLVACTHCGNVKNSYVLFLPGKTMQAFNLQRETFKEYPRCLCKREAGK